MKILGIDPGVSGALAILEGERLTLHHTPVFEITKGKSKRRRIDIAQLHRIIADAGADHAFLEQVSAQPGNGAAAAFTYGQGFGVIEACIALSGTPVTYVLPQMWKKAMGCTSDKDGSRMRICQLMPQYSALFEKKNSHNAAEAALLALWGRDHLK